jgi:phosphoglucomutase
LTPSSKVTIIDPFKEYITVLKSCFDFAALKEFVKRPAFSVLFDGMHGAGGPFARRVLVDELGLPEVRDVVHRKQWLWLPIVAYSIVLVSFIELFTSM